MRTRRDHHQAYRFLTRRIVAAMLSGEPETNELPMRRFALAVFGSVLIAVLVFAGFAVYGLLMPGGARPAQNAIILERETGSKYLYLDGKLHQVLNWTSARLIIGQENPAVRTMSSTSLRGISRGLPVGIPGAPESLPDRRALLGLPVSVCTAPRSSSSLALASQVFVGHTPTSGSPLGADDGLLVSVNAGSDRYLVWHDHRLRIGSNAAVAALNWASVRPVAVSEAFLNALPAGPDLAPITLAGAGTPAVPSIAGKATTIGQLFRVERQHYVMLRTGLTPVGEVAARLWSAGGRPIVEISAQEVGRALVDDRVEPPGLPTLVPEVRGMDSRVAMVCANYQGATDVERPVVVETFNTVSAEMALPETVTASAPSAPGADGVGVADRVAVRGGYGALVSTLAAVGASAPNSVYLITDQGIKYPLPHDDLNTVKASLGYGGINPVPVPGSILALIPSGASLDPHAAALFVPPATASPGRSAGAVG